MDLKKIIPIGIIAVAVLSLVAYFAFKPATPDVPNVLPTMPAQTQTAQTPSGGGTAPVQQQSLEPPADLQPVSSADPATVVPEGMTIQQFLDKYYKAWLSKDWETCFEMQPYAKQQGTDAKSFGESRDSYGLVTYDLGEINEKGNGAAALVELDLGQNGGMSTMWTFVKNDKGQWTVMDAKTGMGQ